MNGIDQFATKFVLNIPIVGEEIDRTRDGARCCVGSGEKKESEEAAFVESTSTEMEQTVTYDICPSSSGSERESTS